MAEDERIPVLKTWKLFVKGAFPRSESGRTLALHGPKGELLAHLSHASRKDLRDAVEAARAAFPAWSGATAYLRGQRCSKDVEPTLPMASVPPPARRAGRPSPRSIGRSTAR